MINEHLTILEVLTMKTLFLSRLAAMSLVAVTSFASAAVIDLADKDDVTGIYTNTSGAFDSEVTFSADFVSTAGTGVLDPFLRIKRNGNEQGYNTSVKILPLDAVSGEKSTRDVLISSLVQTGGVYEFVLDINESIGGSNNLLSLDGLKLYSTSTPSQSGNDIDANGNWIGPTDASLLWDMDLVADNYVLLDAERDNAGSGAGDMLMSVNASIINDAPSSEQYFVLWSRLGTSGVTGASASAGFEEWSTVMSPVSVVPEPSTIALFGLGLIGVMAVARRRKTSESIQA